MKILKDSIEIKTTPEKIFNWFVNLAENYKDWHPDHRDAYWLSPASSMNEGAIFYAEEYLHGKLHKIKFRLKRAIPNNLIEYKNLFPLSLISPGGSFTIEPSESGSIFTATISFRMGKLLSKFAKSQVEAFKIHMKEEGENLKKILEKNR